MPTLLTETPKLEVRLDPPRKRWTRAQCEPLASVMEAERLELIEGELISKMGQNRPHGNTLSAVLFWMADVFGRHFVTHETPIDVAAEDNPTSEPQPDVAVLNRNRWEFTESNPGPADLLLVVEISDTTLRFDRSTKARLYARAGIAEYWVFDVTKRRLIVHREPSAGKYQSVVAYSDQESVAPLASPDNLFPVAKAFGA